MRVNKIKKIDLVKKISEETGFSIKYSKKLTDDFINILLENIKSGYLTLKNIGTFHLKSKKERIGRNPKTKEKFVIKARKSIRFVSSNNLSS